MNILNSFLSKVLPNNLRSYIRFLLETKIEKERRLAVLNFYKPKDYSTLGPEIKEGLKYLKYNKFSAYPYKWALKYENWIPTIYIDKESGFLYILFDGKKMFFPKRYTKKEVIWIVRSIYKEQDEKSPHQYLTPEFQLDNNSIVVDGGVAEGNFALSVVESVKRLYLVECNPEWIVALKLTFSPWKQKVIFIDKYLSDSVTESTTSIDGFINPEKNESFFIKLDIEGYEQLALKGMKNLFASGNPVKLDVCTYHKKNDLTEIGEIISKHGFKFQVSNSYMLYYSQGEMPEFRKVLVRAWKK